MNYSQAYWIFLLCFGSYWQIEVPSVTIKYADWRVW